MTWHREPEHGTHLDTPMTHRHALRAERRTDVRDGAATAAEGLQGVGTGVEGTRSRGCRARGRAEGVAAMSAATAAAAPASLPIATITPTAPLTTTTNT